MRDHFNAIEPYQHFRSGVRSQVGKVKHIKWNQNDRTTIKTKTKANPITKYTKNRSSENSEQDDKTK